MLLSVCVADTFDLAQAFVVSVKLADMAFWEHFDCLGRNFSPQLLR